MQVEFRRISKENLISGISKFELFDTKTKLQIHFFFRILEFIVCSVHKLGIFLFLLLLSPLWRLSIYFSLELVCCVFENSGSWFLINDNNFSIDWSRVSILLSFSIISNLKVPLVSKQLWGSWYILTTFGSFWPKNRKI